MSNCGSCIDGGWWCRGCDGYYKKIALQKHGYDPCETEAIQDFQFAGCENSLAPCFICNRDGKSKCTMDGCSSIPMFWYNFRLPKEEEQPQDQTSQHTTEEKTSGETKDTTDGGEESEQSNEQGIVPRSYIVPDFDIHPTPTFCKCCNKGWWEPGWGKNIELFTLHADYGYTMSQCRKIYQYQFTSKPDSPHVPCFVCNRDGMIPCRELDTAVMAMFWDTFKLSTRDGNDENDHKNDDDDNNENVIERELKRIANIIKKSRLLGMQNEFEVLCGVCDNLNIKIIHYICYYVLP